MKIKKGYAISAFLVIVALVTSLIGTAMAVMAVPVSHACSDNIALVPSASCANGGILPTAGYPATTPSGAAFSPSFTNVSPAVISDPAQGDPINGAGYDTVVLNAVASSYLNATFFSRLETFVRGGGKLIIYTSERTTGNWTGFVRPFTSSNPGQLGAQGTLTISEENTLSKTAPADPYYINVGLISTQSDAVGDANVFTAFDPNWCEDMRATNAVGVNGPVHCYSHLDYGLIIYNGLDIDYMDSTYSGVTPVFADDYLEKIFGLELMQLWYPTGLPCGIIINPGQLSLLPGNASNPTNTQHCVTATLVDGAGVPVQGTEITFTVTGDNPTSGKVTTDAAGQAQFCYTGTVEGQDKIVATCTDPTGSPLTSNEAFKTWTPGGGPQPPIEVGGDIYPTNMLVILAPWLTLAVVVAVGTTILIRRRQHQS